MFGNALHNADKASARLLYEPEAKQIAQTLFVLTHCEGLPLGAGIISVQLLVLQNASLAPVALLLTSAVVSEIDVLKRKHLLAKALLSYPLDMKDENTIAPTVRNKAANTILKFFILKSFIR